MTLPRLFVSSLVALILAAGGAVADEIKITHRGLTLNGELSLAEDKTMSDGIVLLTHGTLAHNRMELIATLQELLYDAGVNTLAINLSLSVDDRHGSYDCAVPHKHLHSDAIGEIDAWTAWLTKKGAGPITVLGHSRGGNQTAQFAAGPGKGKIARAVLMAPGTWSWDRAVKSYRQSHKADLAKVLARAKALVGDGKGDEMMANTGLLYCENAMVSARSFVSYYDDDPVRNTPSVLPRIEQPVLVIAGSADTVVPDIGQQVEPIADGERIRLEVIDGAGHFFRDLYLEDAVDVILAFVE